MKVWEGRVMSKWEETDDLTLISLADQNLSVEEMQKYLHNFSDGSIAIRLNVLKRHNRLPRNFKIRMKNWDEINLINFVKEGLSPYEIAEKYPGISINSIIGRLYTLKKEGEISTNYSIALRKPNQESKKSDEHNEGVENDSNTSPTKSETFSGKSGDDNSINDQLKSQSITKIETIETVQQQAESEIGIKKISRSRYTIIESQTNAEEHKISFLDLLTKNIELFEGANKEIQKYCPNFFELLSNILNDKFVDWHTKLLISAALGYFVLEDDVIPDTEERGYIDDLYIVTYVLNEIKNNQSSEIIIRNWTGEEDIVRLIDEIYIAASDIVGHLSKPILQKVGLYKYSLLSLEEYSGEYPKRFAKVSREKRELLGLLAYIIRSVEGDELSRRSYESIRRYVENNGNYDEIQRIIEISKLYHQIETESFGKQDDFVKMLEQRMREARFCALKEKK
jgi:uncharacterized membrane protein YkvA (DUF1232 family)